MIKTASMLMDDLKSYADPFQKVRALCGERKLFQLKKGLYETDESVSGYLLAGALYGPSYLSFYYALSYYGLISEKVYEYTSATAGKKKKKYYTNPFGSYSYRDVPEKAFCLDVSIKTENGYSYMIASPEKALCDLLYTLPPVKNLREMRALLFDNLRIEKASLKKTDSEKILELNEYYHSTNIGFLYKLLRSDYE